MNQLKSLLLFSALAMAGLAQAGELTVTASGASASLNLNGNGVEDAFVFSPTISADTSNYSVKAAALSAGWNGTKPLNATVTIAPGVYVFANSTSAYSFDTGNTFPTGSTLALVNNGLIIGMGGAGGASGYSGAPGGNSGGPSLRAQVAINVTNNGVIAGGGGGGAGGGVAISKGESYGGGGGGGGRPYGGGGAGAPGSSGSGWNGASGTLASPGAGGTGSRSNSGGAGGDLGAAGANTAGFIGGAAGAAVTGNANITWTATGTRLGAIN